MLRNSPPGGGGGHNRPVANGSYGASKVILRW